MNEQEIFHSALALPSEARVEYLDRVCAGNAAQRASVEGLLRANDEASGFLDRPPGGLGGTVEHDVPGAAPGAVIAGRYKLLEQIGEGGMGTVWVAEQTEPVKRKVALKLVKPGMDSKSVLARFEAERQALALMDHQNIAKVLDGGATEQGRPFFVMELVKGMPLMEYCDARRMTIRERLDVFVQICSAVQHAHQKGVIHRDLKPTNILVTEHDGRPVPKIIDFGLAKALSAGTTLTDHTLHTAFGTIVGTPLYMAPEQVAANGLDVDTRSDVYSLGVILYELLTGTTPLEKKRLKQAAWDEIRRVIREEEPPKPSMRLSDSHDSLPSISAQRHTEPASLTKAIRGELDWIAMKALEKDRNRRYATANSLASDVQRFLADEPVQACPPSKWYRAKKLVRRNKTAVALGLAALIALVTVAGSLGWTARVLAERLAKAATQVALITDEVKRLKEEQKWPEALAAAKRAESVIASGEVDEATRNTVDDMLKELKFIDRLEQVRMTAATWVDVAFDYAGADRRYAETFREYGIDVDTLPVETSIARLRTRPSISIPLAAALDNWANVRWRSNGDAADRRQLASVARGIDSDPLRNRLRSIAERPAAQVGIELRQLASSINARSEHPATIVVLCDHLARASQPEPAVRLLKEAQRTYPEDFWINFYLAFLLHSQRDFEGAVRFYTAAVSLRPRATAALNNLGSSLTDRKKVDEAIAFYRKTVELDPNHALAHRNLAGALTIEKKLDEAIVAYRSVIKLVPNDAVAHHLLGVTLWNRKKADEAIAAYRKAIELNPNHGAAHHALAGAMEELDRTQEAIAAYRKTIELEPKNATAHINLAWHLATCDDAACRNPTEAVAFARKAVELEPNHTGFPGLLGEVCYRANDWKAAAAALDRSIALKRGGDRREWLFLAMAHWQLGEKAKAREWYDRAAARMDKIQPQSEGMRRLRKEAADLLGVREKNN